MIYKLVSSRRIISKILADLDIQEQQIRISDVIEWIGESLEKIGSIKQYVYKESGVGDSRLLPLKDYQVKLPSDLHQLSAIAYSKSENGPWEMARSTTGVFKNMQQPSESKKTTTDWVANIRCEFVLGPGNDSKEPTSGWSYSYPQAFPDEAIWKRDVVIYNSGKVRHDKGYRITPAILEKGVLYAVNEYKYNNIWESSYKYIENATSVEVRDAYVIGEDDSTNIYDRLRTIDITPTKSTIQYTYLGNYYPPQPGSNTNNIDLNIDNNTTNYSADVQYFIKPGYIVTNKKEGYLKIAYYALPVDSDGYPLVPDSASYSEAIYWYVVSKLKYPEYLAGRLQKYIYDEIRQSWGYYRQQAYGEAMMPNEGDMISIKNQWLKIVPEVNEEDTFYSGVGARQKVYNKYYGRFY